MGFGDLFNTVFINPITNLLIAIYNLLASIGIPYALGFSIILLTILVRVILWPFVSAQIKSAQSMQKVAPHLAQIRAKYKNDKKKQQEEMMKLYKEHGVNPVGGCLPAIIQIPIFISLYQVLNRVVGLKAEEIIVTVNDIVYFDALKIQRAFDTTFFGLPLATVPKDHFTSQPWLVLVPVITGLLQFLLSKMMMPDAALNAQMALAKKTPQKSDDFQTAMQKQTLFIFPVMIAFFSFTFPIGLSLYWNTFTLFGILQQYILAGPGGAKPWFDKVKSYGRKS